MSRRGIWLSLSALLLVAQLPSRAQDRALAVPEMKVLLQNDRVRVQYHDVAVGETTPMHSHPAYVAYVFGDYAGTSILPDGREIPLTRRKGDVFFNEPVTHRIVNTGSLKNTSPFLRVSGISRPSGRIDVPA